MTDFEEPEREFQTFRADLPSRRGVSEPLRMLIVGMVVGVLATILGYAWITRPAANPAWAHAFHLGLAQALRKPAR